MKKVINVGQSTYVLVFDEFEDNVDIDSLLRIDYSNLLGEMITFPTIVAKFGCMLAEVESQVSEKKLNLDVQEAKLKEEYRLKLSEQNGGKNPTIDAVNTAVLLDERFQDLKRDYIGYQKIKDYLLTTYLAAKDKSDKISKVYMQSQEADIPDSVIEGRVNQTMISKKQKLIK